MLIPANNAANDDRSAEVYSCQRAALAHKNAAKNYAFETVAYHPLTLMRATPAFHAEIHNRIQNAYHNADNAYRDETQSHKDVAQAANAKIHNLRRDGGTPHEIAHY